MSLNPFTSNIYQDLWLKYFAKAKKSYSFNFIKDIKFIKHPLFSYYINVGKNSTNGISYILNDKSEDYKNKTFLIYDVPSICEMNKSEGFKSLKTYKIEQYKGFLANFDEFNSLNEYMVSVMSSKSRNKYKSTLRKFEKCFDVSYKIYYKDVTETEYNEALNNFKNLIIERHKDLKIDTNIIDKWNFYQELLFSLIRQGKALLNCVNINNKPISMSLAFVDGQNLIGSIKAFNPDYYKFNTGHIELGKLIEWCFDNKISKLDFSKGEYEYKSKWTNEEYKYYCHVIYDSSNFYCVLTSSILANYFKLKQYLRNRNVNLFLKKLKFQFKSTFRFKTKKEPKISIKPIEKDFNFNDLDLIHVEDDNLNFLNRTVIDLLYRNPEPISNIKIYIKKEKNLMNYIVVGKENNFQIVFTPN